MKAKIKSMIWNIRRQKTTNENKREKKNPKEEDSISSFWDNLRSPTFASGGGRRRRERAKNWKSLALFSI